MKQVKFAIAVVFMISLFATESFASEAKESASDVVKNFYSVLTETMKQGEQLGFDGRFKKLEPAIKEAFNLPLMARYAAGSAWREAKEEERNKLIEAFTSFSVANYASQFKKFDGEKFEVIGEKPASGGGIIVETKIVPRDEAPVTINYLLRADDKGKQKIVDVFLNASISELSTRRSEFMAIIRRSGWAALIASLDEKTKKMGG